ncbi:DUF2946 family protein [Tardiphaga sp. P9-11]|jgi:hypothetical protein|uniref:DUF2946 family protein n=1 Tax=Tardiphaga sp. P9-11 TaxID=2024614 RepID=UPI0011F0C747|nr:DUF2946 family protein [Tardiphaga sp. P9-11]KAA0078457.1 DUF2946 domain-containing protein [Tardiphaga sp. P9-11]
MKWFRTNIRHGAKLALFALAVQLILSFGHVHGGTVHAAPLDATFARAASDAVQTPAAPDTDHHHRAADPCAICAVMAMAGTALFAAPPVLLLPQAAVLLQRITTAEFEHLDAISGASQPRGPPVS